jgi:crotonobetainyl-CoA:carnitine CoA-transferase CaiB-like acyl-CoA transferase
VKRMALEGLKVLDVSRYGPAPFCTMVLGDLGADILRIDGAAWELEVREFPAPDSPFDPLNRNKRSLELNMKKDEGKRIFYQLVEKSDIVVEGFRPGVSKRLGIDYETLNKINPKIICCAISGYGQDGPLSNLVGHDITYIAQGGVLGIMSRPDVIPGNIIGDWAGGGLQGVIGILAAVVARQTTGKGQFVDIAIADGVTSFLCSYIAKYLETGSMPAEEDRTTIGAEHYYNVYETKDNKFIAIASAEPKFFANLCKALGREEYVSYQMDRAKAKEIRAFFTETFLTKTRDEWFSLLYENDTAVGKVYSIGELISDPQVLHRQMIVELNHPMLGKIRQSGIPIKLSDTPGRIRKFSPKIGEDTVEVLSELGYSESDIVDLRRKEILGVKR